ncbi:MAG: hypothetical protein HC898_03095 [Phycisphaerales bacterium]|nr:hypothetical protein [Phycisphaerales bacterium]
MRRVIYYEFRPIPVELKYGPHKPEYVPVKQKLLLAALRERARAPYAKGEEPFVYQPDAGYAPPALGTEENCPPGVMLMRTTGKAILNYQIN